MLPSWYIVAPKVAFPGIAAFPKASTLKALKTDAEPVNWYKLNPPCPAVLDVYVLLKKSTPPIES